MYILTKNDKCSKYIQSENFERMCFFRFFFSLLIIKNHREVCESVFYRDYQDNPQGHVWK